MSDLVERLLAAMTLDEKLGQLNMIDAGAPPGGDAGMRSEIRAGRIGSLLNIYGAAETNALQRLAVEESRLRIPLLFGYDVLHGHRTIFPIPLAEACAFDPGLWERTARAAAREAARDGLALTFAPMLDVSRDPRWGRIAESPGEDAFLASRYGEAKIRGFQGDDLSASTSIAATAKHIGAYGAVAAGREYASADVSERELEEVHLPPFWAAAKAGTAAVMPSQNDVAGIPANAHGRILNGFLRGRAGFGGVVISDYLSVAELIVHGIAEDLAQAAACALNGGVDVDMQSQAYVGALPAALDRGAVTMDAIDRAARRVLALKVRLGLFDDPFARAAQPALSEAEREGLATLSREAARRSIVLLKNERSVLPLSRARRIALVGPLADAPLEMFGPWFAAAGLEAATIAEGLRAALPEAEIRCVAGVPLDGDDDRGIADAIAAGEGADIVILALGEPKTLSGEAHSRGRIDLPGRQRVLAEAMLRLSKPTVAILSHGRPLTLPWLFARADAVLATWFLGSQAGRGIADVLTGTWNPSGRLSITWPVDVGQIPIFHAARPTGRPGRDDVHYSSRHIDLPVAPQFAFGHGLSYTRFRVARLAAMPSEFAAGGRVMIEAEVANEGDVAGEETVFLFVRDPVASVARPVLELKGFAKAVLGPGARTTLRFTLTSDDLAFLDQNLQPCIEPGDFEILVGPCADRARLTTTTVRLLAAGPA